MRCEYLKFGQVVKTATLWVALGVLSLPWPLQAKGLSAELRVAMASARADDRLSVIVDLVSGVDVQKLRADMRGLDRDLRREQVVRRLKLNAGTRADALMERGRRGGAEDIQSLWIANAVAMRAPAELISSLALDPGVQGIRLDGVTEAPIAYAGATLPAEWNIIQVGAPELWQRGIRGAGAVIAILDSGVDNRHPDLSASWRGGANSWFDPYGQHPTPADSNGHGTQAVGLIVGGSASGSNIGVAPDAKWIAAKIFNDAGQTSESAVHRAFQWALDPDGNPATDDAPDVVNNSWDIAAEDSCNSAFQADIDALRAADIAVVFSAGNYGPSPATSVSPANNNNVVSVGALDQAQQVADFSSRGPSACDGGIFPKLVAPGDGVLTTDLSFGGQPYYALVAGTSFAAPHISGVMALLRSASPLSSAEQLETALTATARDVAAPGQDPDSGYGLVDAVAALAALPPTDLDGDGFGAGRDCNDRDPAIHPGATDVRRDGIDQDCNGYDLTLSIKYAVYSHDGATLKMRVSSGYEANAALEIVGMGAMEWRAPYRDWIYSGAANGAPAQIVVKGKEGETRVRPRPPQPSR